VVVLWLVRLIVPTATLFHSLLLYVELSVPAQCSQYSELATPLVILHVSAA
jgi:hypothetical protein